MHLSLHDFCVSASTCHIRYSDDISYSHVQAVLFEKYNQSNCLDKHQENETSNEGNLEGLKHRKEIKDLGNHLNSL